MNEQVVYQPKALPEFEKKFALVNELYNQAVDADAIKNSPASLAVVKHYAALLYKYESLVRLNTDYVAAFKEMEEHAKKIKKKYKKKVPVKDTKKAKKGKKR